VVGGGGWGGGESRVLDISISLDMGVRDWVRYPDILAPKHHRHLRY
jgi:hypothetical protein